MHGMYVPTIAIHAKESIANLTYLVCLPFFFDFQKYSLLSYTTISIINY